MFVYSAKHSSILCSIQSKKTLGLTRVVFVPPVESTQPVLLIPFIHIISWTWVWASSVSWWWTGKPGVLQFMGLQRVGHDWATELTHNLNYKILVFLVPFRNWHIHLEWTNHRSLSPFYTTECLRRRMSLLSIPSLTTSFQFFHLSSLFTSACWHFYTSNLQISIGQGGFSLKTDSRIINRT